jgi:hypothetical protein
MFFIIFILCCTVNAEWPPDVCSKDVAYDGETVVMTSSKHNNIITSCNLREKITSSIYIEFSRRYAPGRRSIRSQSSMYISAEKKFVVTIKNDRIDINYGKDQTARCLMSSVSNDNRRSWLRLRINNMRDIYKTLINVDMAALGSDTFYPCVTFEIDDNIIPFKLKLGGKTSTGMDQSFHKITRSRPVFTDNPDIKLLKRVSQLESKVERMETSMSRQLSSIHQEYSKLHVKIKKTDTDISERVSKSHQEVHEKVWSSSMVIVWFVVVAFILFGCYMRWRFWFAKRHHLL